ncbi:MAG: DUF4255 domain-containing protein [Acidobacteriia bacterium]|nr:DUF4255 domain-containing protein [Terriglobia bacterium]
MPPALLGLLDLSVVTDLLVQKLKDCRDQSPIWNPNNLPHNPGPSYTINITGVAPDELRSTGDCELTLYLFHVSQDKFQRNMPPFTPPPPGNHTPVAFQPLTLNLYYLVTAYAKGDYVHEQQAMSIALRCFHEDPILTTTVVLGGQGVKQEWTLTMEIESTEELGRLWQATTVAMRLSTIYRVSVVMLSPETSAFQLAPKPRQIGLAVDATALPFAAAGQVIGTFRTVAYHSPDSTAGNPDIKSFDLSPATVAPGETVFLYGAGLKDRVYLLAPDGTESNITAWLTAPAPPQSETRFTLKLPSAVGALPANSPPAGVYQLRVGNNLPATDPGAVRSNATPFSIAARVDATDPPVLSGAGPFTIQGAGFVTGKTELLLDPVPLAEGPAAAGKFTVNPGGTAITFQPPANLATARYTIRIRVNGVESAPAWWLQV